jgi:hypothetical protein
MTANSLNNVVFSLCFQSEKQSKLSSKTSLREARSLQTTTIKATTNEE